MTCWPPGRPEAVPVAEIVTLLLEDARQAWVEGIYASDENAAAGYRDYLISRFGLAEVERVESEGGDFTDLVSYTFGHFESPI